MNRLAILLFCCLLINASAANISLGSNQSLLAKQQPGLANQQKLKIRSAQQAARKVVRRYGGRVLKVSNKRVNGGPGYKVKLLKNNGQIITVLVDAVSGRITGT